MSTRSSELQQRNKRTAIWLSLAVALMFGFGFALVPLYDVFCYLTGINGKTQRTADESTVSLVETDRSVVIEFVTNIGSDLPWRFRAEQVRLTVYPGAMNDAVFTIHNESTSAVAAQAIPSVAPGLAARYLVKTECFCFARQTLQPGETRRLPVRFYVDPKLPRNVPVVTLSYTFFSLPEQIAARDGRSNDAEPKS
jgi:cytochrome c oxidase assembly protein subunit 11